MENSGERMVEIPAKRAEELLTTLNDVYQKLQMPIFNNEFKVGYAINNLRALRDTLQIIVTNLERYND